MAPRLAAAWACFGILLLEGNGWAQQDELETVTVAHWGHEKILIYLPLYVAIDAGFFAREGLQVRIEYSGNDDQVFASVASGRAEFGVGDPTFTAISREKGGPGKVVATLVGAVANWVVGRESVQLAAPEGLDGKRVTSFPSPSTTFTVLTEIKQEYNLTNMTIVELLFGTELAALERGSADLAIMLEPQASIAESQGFHVVWSLANHYGPFTLTGVTTTDDLIANNPELVARFVNGIQAALHFIHKSPAATARIAQDNFPALDPQIVLRATNRMIHDRTIPMTAEVAESAWRKTLTIRHAVGDLESVDAGMQAVDNRFAAAAMVGGGRPIWTTGRGTSSPNAGWKGILAVVADLATLILAILAAVASALWLATIHAIQLSAAQRSFAEALLRVFDRRSSERIAMESLRLELGNELNIEEADITDHLQFFADKGIVRIAQSGSGEETITLRYSGRKEEKLRRLLR